MKIDIHLNQSLAPWSRLRHFATSIDGGLFDALWVLDHFAPLGEGKHLEMLESTALLGALGASTEHLRLGALVNNVVNRQPAVIAQATSTLQHITNGRFVLGLGAGASPSSRFAAEHRSLKIPLLPTMSARHDALESTLREIRAIWSGERNTETNFAIPLPTPPVVIGVNSVALARRATSNGCGINVRWNHPQLKEILDVSNRAALSEDSDWVRSVWMPWDASLAHPYATGLQTYHDLGVTRVIFLTTEPEDLDEITSVATL